MIPGLESLFAFVAGLLAFLESSRAAADRLVSPVVGPAAAGGGDTRDGRTDTKDAYDGVGNGVLAAIDSLGDRVEASTNAAAQLVVDAINRLSPDLLAGPGGPPAPTQALSATLTPAAVATAPSTAARPVTAFQAHASAAVTGQATLGPRTVSFPTLVLPEAFTRPVPSVAMPGRPGVQAVAIANPLPVPVSGQPAAVQSPGQPGPQGQPAQPGQPGQPGPQGQGAIALGQIGNVVSRAVQQMTAGIRAVTDSLKTLTSGATTAFAAISAGMVGLTRAASPGLFDTLMKSGKLLAATLGNTLVQPILTVSFALQNMAQWFHALDPAIKKKIGLVVGLGAAVAGSVMVFGKLTGVLGSVVMLAGPVVAAVLAMGKAVFLAVTGATSGLNLILPAIAAVVGGLAALTAAFGAFSIGSAIAAKGPIVFLPLVNGAMKAWEAVKAVFAKVGEITAPIVEAAAGIGAKLLGGVSGIIGGVSGIIGELVGPIEDGLKVILPVVADLGDAIATALGSTLRGALGGARAFIEAIKPSLAHLWEAVERNKPAFERIAEAIKAMGTKLEELAPAIGRVVGWMASTAFEGLVLHLDSGAKAAATLFEVMAAGVATIKPQLMVLGEVIRAMGVQLLGVAEMMLKVAAAAPGSKFMAGKMGVDVDKLQGGIAEAKKSMKAFAMETLFKPAEASKAKGDKEKEEKKADPMGWLKERMAGLTKLKGDMAYQKEFNPTIGGVAEARNQFQTSVLSNDRLDVQMLEVQRLTYAVAQEQKRVLDEIAGKPTIPLTR